jgi:hypothetical protein
VGSSPTGATILIIYFINNLKNQILWDI